MRRSDLELAADRARGVTGSVELNVKTCGMAGDLEHE
jgi:hypothetical protein